ncbi:MAG TPA: DNA N-6-adenine-methyltransferase [Patescibacteria group bacterium]|nr:DNA N-6-adenine-methyltransferase [Patescibacteria group bacterium]
MKKNDLDVMFSSKSDLWSTPQEFYDKLNDEFHFTLDPCSTHENHKCEKYYTMEDDGLAQSWEGETVFVNPPYSETKLWLKKAFDETRYNNKVTTVAMLIPSRTDTKYFHEYCMKADEIRFVKGRLKFGGQKNSAPFPSMVVVFRSNYVHSENYVPDVSAMERK